MIYDQKYYEHSDWYLWARRAMKKQNQDWENFAAAFSTLMFLLGIALGILIGWYVA